ncbi:MAG: ATP-binding protein [Candidatus Micrarchaeales archaeon]
MILKESLCEVVKSQRAELESAGYGIERERLKSVNLRPPYALIISGVRRCGKSTLLRQLLEMLPNFYYLNFEDTRLAGFETSDFEKLDEIFKSVCGTAKFYLFDEIQNIEGWELFVRSRLDQQKKFIITGSNASLLSKELGTRLTGRHLNIELFPFSFGEALKFKKDKANKKTFGDYLKSGGFPQYLKYKNDDILRELFTDIIQRDIVARYNIRDSRTLNEMALYLLTNVGKEFSYTGLKKMFNLGSTNTAISFVSYFEDSYLLFTVPQFDYSIKKQLINPKKIYSIDNGMSAVNSVSYSKDKGRMLENIVFLNLRKSHGKIFYFKGKHECDFLIKKGNNIEAAIQVSYALTEDNKDREFEGLIEALDKFKLDEGLILTYDQEDDFSIRGKRIIVRPAWKWAVETGKKQD